MTEEFYHKDIFGQVVDVDLARAEEFEKLPLDKKGKEFNIFSLTDAIGAKRKKDAWIIYQKALVAGLSAEEIFFRIVWQVKSLLLAQRTKNVEETDMKPYPYMKAKGFLKNFKQGELEGLSEDLVLGYYLARKGVGEVDILIEKILLKL